MTIVCGTDFSPPAAAAAEVAARLAARLNARLVLVHAVDELGAEHALRAGEPQYEPLRAQLDAEAERLRRFGAAVETLVEGHEASRTLLRVASDRDATLVVLAPVGEGGAVERVLGSTAARVASRASRPVLVVRDAEPFRHWLDDGTLRAVVGVDTSGSADAALRWLEGIRAAGRVDVVALRVASSVDEHRRLGLRGPVDLEELSDEARAALRRDLEQQVGTLAGNGSLEFLVRHGLGRVDADLLEAAEQVDADLVVVGAHQWSFLERLVRGSVSKAVLDRATRSVACIPGAADPREARIGTVDTVLVATDFSPESLPAIPHAYALLANGGTVHLLTVSEGDEDREALERRLAGLVPAEAAGRRVRTRLHVIDRGNAAEAIAAAAERLGADVVCVGTHGRSGLSEAVLGSVAQDVLRRTRRPVLMVRG